MFYADLFGISIASCLHSVPGRDFDQICTDTIIRTSLTSYDSMSQEVILFANLD